jgi:hypothetical protein
MLLMFPDVFPGRYSGSDMDLCAATILFYSSTATHRTTVRTELAMKHSRCAR